MIYIDDSSILFGMDDIALVYTEGNITIEQIQEKSYYNEVKYIDDHWYVGRGD